MNLTQESMHGYGGIFKEKKMEEKKESFMDKKIDINFSKIFSIFKIKSLEDKTSEEYNPTFITFLRVLPVITFFIAMIGMYSSSNIFQVFFFASLMVLNVFCSAPLISDLHTYHSVIKSMKRKEEIENSVQRKFTAGKDKLPFSKRTLR